MSEIQKPDSFENIHFPQRTILIKRLRIVSFFINDFVLALSFLVLAVWIVGPSAMRTFLFQNLHISPFIAILFICSGAPLLFGAKRHLIQAGKNTEKEEYPWWNTLFPIFFAGLTALLGIFNVAHFENVGVLSFVQVSPYEGVCFLLIGLALIPPFTRILHRFHVTQLLIFVVSSLNVFVVLEYIFQLFSPFAPGQIVFASIPVALTFIIFCFGIQLRWSNRGFFGNLTLDSIGSVFAFRLFAINLLAAPLFAFVVLMLFHNAHYNMYQILTLIVVGFTSISCTILWANARLLYKYELEHLLMRESLRAHNIDLTSDKEALSKRMSQIEQEKQQYIDKLNTQNTLRDVTDTLR